MMKNISLSFVFVILFCQTLLSQKIDTKAPGFTLSTQYNQSFTYNFPDGKKTIIIIGDRKSGKQASEWGKKLKAGLKDSIQYIHIAATGWVPFFAKNQVLDGFANKPSILIDWNNAVSNKIDYSNKKAMVVFINAEGLIKASVKGDLTEEKYTRFIAEVK